LIGKRTRRRRQARRSRGAPSSGAEGSVRDGADDDVADRTQVVGRRQQDLHPALPGRHADDLAADLEDVIDDNGVRLLAGKGGDPDADVVRQADEL
jgi:hypothetical protein